MKKILMTDLKSIGTGLLLALFLLFQLAVWRMIETETFLFLQILVITLINYFLILLIRLKLFIGLQRSIFTALLLSFILVSFTTLNIDRSRSFTALKWVHELQFAGPVSVSEIDEAKNLTQRDLVAIEQRLEEQAQLGSLVKDKDGFVLSRFGRIIISLANGLSSFCNLKGYRNM